MALPPLANWDATRDALHEIALALGAIRVACSDPLPNDLHFSLDVTADGISTTGMRCGGELHFDLKLLQLNFVRGDCVVFRLDVAGLSQITLLRRLLACFRDCGYGIGPSMKHITSETEFAIDGAAAESYALALNAAYTDLARFRAKLRGYMTPLALWPHHFDLAFIWFPTDKTDEQSDPQIAYGFAPCSPGLERPYFYAYAWSKASGYLDFPLDAPAQAIREGYIGLYAGYDELRDEAQHGAVLEKMLLNYHHRASAKLRS
ncbi:MAG: DUF5996 family protein [Chloroflexi bacterium]|nr:DUF5996 family protein [Chloroflexota bacterium]